MRTSYAMMASSVTLPAEDEGAEEDGAVEARRAAIPIRSCVALRRTVVASMAHMNVKRGEMG